MSLLRRETHRPCDHSRVTCARTLARYQHPPSLFARLSIRIYVVATTFESTLGSISVPTSLARCATPYSVRVSVPSRIFPTDVEQNVQVSSLDYLSSRHRRWYALTPLTQNSAAKHSGMAIRDRSQPRRRAGATVPQSDESGCSLALAMFDFLKVTSRGYTSVVSTARGWPWLLFSVAFLCCVFFLYVTFNHFATRMQALANKQSFYLVTFRLDPHRW